MSELRFSLHSEAYSASGNLAADGYRKLLGAPSIDLIQTVVREAVQNSCDASLEDGNAEVHFRLRTLDHAQRDCLRDRVLAQRPGDAGAEDLATFLSSDTPRVLEICDFGTGGLAGPTRADLAPDGHEPTDFVDFLRNIGSRRNTHHGGGTYGYGKTSLYLASQCSTIVIDTKTVCRGEGVRRLIGARLGSAYDAPDSIGLLRRYTGRHWWGMAGEDGIVDPLEGEEAEAMAAELGFPERLAGDRGTSIMILDPIFDAGNDAQAISMIRESLLWFFWPRLIETTPAHRRMHFRIFHGNNEQQIPRPEDFPPLDLFARAMNGLRHGDPDVQEIRSKSPRRHLGRLNIAKGLVGARREEFAGPDSPFMKRSASIAVMRPVELVVSYRGGDAYLDERIEWAGVFVASDEDEVEAAFAKAEPPAHDDWQPGSITDKAQASMVRVALREIDSIAHGVAGPATIPSSSGGRGPSLAPVAGLLGRGLVGQGRDGAGPRTPRGGGTGGRRSHRVSAPSFLRLEQSAGGVVAIFEATVTSDGSRSNLLKLLPSLVVDGGTIADDSEVDLPTVIAVRRAGEPLGSGTNIDLGTTEGPLEIDVLIPGEYAVQLDARLEAAGDAA